MGMSTEDHLKRLYKDKLALSLLKTVQAGFPINLSAETITVDDLMDSLRGLSCTQPFTNDNEYNYLSHVEIIVELLLGDEMGCGLSSEVLARLIQDLEENIEAEARLLTAEM